MSRYPINIENELTELEKQNRAYDQGLKDGFAGPFENARCLVSVPTECIEVQRASKEMKKLVGDISEIVFNEFEAHGFSDVMESLGPVPKECCWGEKIYATMQASYLQGFFLAFRMSGAEKDVKESDCFPPVRTV